MNNQAIDLKNGSVPVLFRKLLIPTLLGSISVSAVTAIDGIFVGHGVGTDGVAAVNIIVPLYQVISGIGLMVGTGCSVVASINVARQNIMAARQNITQTISITSLLTTFLCLFFIIFPSHTATILGASDTLMPQVTDYLIWIAPGFVVEMWSIIGLFVIRLDGSPRYAMWCNIIPALLNVLFDWLFIFVFDLGVKGAAMATSISLVAGGIMAIAYLAGAAESLKLVMPAISQKEIITAIRNMGIQCKIGASSLFGELTMAVLIFVGNLTFMKYIGDTGVGAFGIACYYAPFFFMVGNAIAQSAQPIISYNYGISRKKEIRQALSLLLITSLAIGVTVALLFFAVPHKLVALFVDTDSISGQIAIIGFPYFAVGIVFFILNVAITGYCQSVEQIKKASLIVMLRGFILLIPSFILLPKLFGTEGIWLAMPLAELATTLLFLCFVRSK